MNIQLTKTDAIHIARDLLHSCLRTGRSTNANGTIFGAAEGWIATIGGRWIVRLTGGGALLGPVEAATPIQPEPANNEQHIAAAGAHDRAAAAHEERQRENAAEATSEASTATMAAPRCSARGSAANAECEAIAAEEMRHDGEGRAADAAHDRAAAFHRDAATQHRKAAAPQPSGDEATIAAAVRRAFAEWAEGKTTEERAAAFGAWLDHATTLVEDAAHEWAEEHGVPTE